MNNWSDTLNLMSRTVHTILRFLMYIVLSSKYVYQKETAINLCLLTCCTYL